MPVFTGEELRDEDDLKTLVGAAAIAGALGFQPLVWAQGVANAATLAPSIPGPVHTVQAPADLGPPGRSRLMTGTVATGAGVAAVMGAGRLG